MATWNDRAFDPHCEHGLRFSNARPGDSNISVSQSWQYILVWVLLIGLSLPADRFGKSPGLIRQSIGEETLGQNPGPDLLDETGVFL